MPLFSILVIIAIGLFCVFQFGYFLILFAANLAMQIWQKRPQKQEKRKRIKGE